MATANNGNNDQSMGEPVYSGSKMTNVKNQIIIQSNAPFHSKEAQKLIKAKTYKPAINGKIMRYGTANNMEGMRLDKINEMKLAINSSDEKNISALLDYDEMEYFEEDEYEIYNTQFEEDSYDINRNKSTFSKKVWNETGLA